MGGLGEYVEAHLDELKKWVGAGLDVIKMLTG